MRGSHMILYFLDHLYLIIHNGSTPALILMEAIIFSIFTFISTSVGGLVALKNRKNLHYIMSFTAGVLIGVCFFDILPEAIAIISGNEREITPFTIMIVLGFMFFHILEKTISIHHAHEEEYASHTHTHPNVGLAGALGLAFHSFLDGVGIGFGFQINPAIGVLVAIAVIAHDFSDGLNTVTLMIRSKNKTMRTYALLFLDAIAPVLGVLTTLFFTIPEHILLLYLGFFMGFLIYIAASDLLPEAHSKHSSYKMIALTLLGLLFIFTISRFT